jgi:hypothetical protein
MTRQERKEATAFNHMVKKHAHALVEEPKQVIPYTREQLTWHLRSNAGIWSDVAMEKIISQIEKVTSGEASLKDFISDSVEVKIWEMLDDLKIDYIA